MSPARCIATSSDHKYFPALIALLASLKKTNPDIPVTVFDGGLTKSQVNKAGRYARIIKKQPFMNLANKGKFGYIGNTTLLKFEAAELDCDTVLYLDVDMVVLERVDELFSFPPETVAVVNEVNALKNMFRPRHRGMLAEAIDIDWESPGFNAGLFVLRPQEWRDIKSKALKLVERFGEDVFSKTKDQQLLNIIFSGNTFRLSGKYNFSPLYDEGDHEPTIVHYLAESKPWHFDYPEGHRYEEFRRNVSVWDYPNILLTDIARLVKRFTGWRA
ncbi:MAG: glycosyltransferase [Candidatus Tantalella remota]|nr:glycosyltransferase [Candidatus Tantalella remota]